MLKKCVFAIIVSVLWVAEESDENTVEWNQPPNRGQEICIGFLALKWASFVAQNFIGLSFHNRNNKWEI